MKKNVTDLWLKLNSPAVVSYVLFCTLLSKSETSYSYCGSRSALTEGNLGQHSLKPAWNPVTLEHVLNSEIDGSYGSNHTDISFGHIPNATDAFTGLHHAPVRFLFS